MFLHDLPMIRPYWGVIITVKQQIAACIGPFGPLPDPAAPDAAERLPRQKAVGQGIQQGSDFGHQ